MSWQSIDSALKDGSPVWLSWRPYIAGALKPSPFFTVKPARYDTWNCAWRHWVTGETLFPQTFLREPEYWQPFVIPEKPADIPWPMYNRE